MIPHISCIHSAVFERSIHGLMSTTDTILLELLNGQFLNRIRILIGNEPIPLHVASNNNANPSRFAVSFSGFIKKILRADYVAFSTHLLHLS